MTSRVFLWRHQRDHCSPVIYSDDPLSLSLFYHHFHRDCFLFSGRSVFTLAVGQWAAAARSFVTGIGNQIAGNEGNLPEIANAYSNYRQSKVNQGASPRLISSALCEQSAAAKYDDNNTKWRPVEGALINKHNIKYLNVNK